MKLLLLLTLLSLSCFVAAQAPTVAEKNAPSKITITTKAEPGERLTVSGLVSGTNGKTPLAKASVYVYHTDATGRYTPGPKDDNRSPTDRARAYDEFQATRPARKTTTATLACAATCAPTRKAATKGGWRCTQDVKLQALAK